MAKRLQELKTSFNTLLQIGAWCNLAHPDCLNASYYAHSNKPFWSSPCQTKYIDKALQFEKQLYQDMDIIFTTNSWMQQSFIDDFSVNKNKVYAVATGINLPKQDLDKLLNTYLQADVFVMPS